MRVLFSRNFAYVKFLEIKSSQNGEITLSFTDLCKSCPSRDYNVANMSFNAYREHKILAKISEFTLHCLIWGKNEKIYSETIIVGHAVLQLVCSHWSR